MRWPLFTLPLALATPAFSVAFRLAGRPGGDAGAFAVEVAMLATCALLVGLVRTKEKASWESLGLGRRPVRETVLLTLGGLVAVAAALGALVAILQALGVAGPQGDAAEPPLWLIGAMVTRAGVVEEITYRGIAIDRMAALTGSRTLGWLLTLVIFALFHFRQGVAGIAIAFVAGGVLTALFLWRRNLWACIAIHFLGDFIPNILLPALGVGE